MKIRYGEKFGPEETDIIIEPYFLEPSLFLHTITVIAYSPKNKSLSTYDLHRIIGEVTILPKTYDIPVDFNPVDTINSAWGMYTDGEAIPVKLRFKPRVSRMVMSTIWHPSQTAELQSDGSLIATFKVRKASSFRSWVLSWGNEVEVLEPKTFREQINNLAKSIIQVYSH